MALTPATAIMLSKASLLRQHRRGTATRAAGWLGGARGHSALQWALPLFLTACNRLKHSTAQHSSAEQRSAVHTAPGSKHGELGAAVLQLAPQAGSVYRRGKGCGHTAQGNGLVSEQQGGE